MLAKRIIPCLDVKAGRVVKGVNFVGHADAVLAASIFHYGEFTVQQAKQLMASRGIEVRL